MYSVQSVLFVCPHAAIRPMLLDDEEKAAAPESFKTIKAVGKGP